MGRRFIGFIDAGSFIHRDFHDAHIFRFGCLVWVEGTWRSRGARREESRRWEGDAFIGPQGMIWCREDEGKVKVLYMPAWHPITSKSGSSSRAH